MRNLFVCFITLGIFSCEMDKHHGNTNNNATTSQIESKSIFGLYSHYLTLGEDSDCETLKRALRLNEDSTFVMKEYCLSNFMSTWNPSIKIGVFRMESPTIYNFSCSDKSVFKIKFVNDSTLEITPRRDDTYPYLKDTTTYRNI